MRRPLPPLTSGPRVRRRCTAPPLPLPTCLLHCLRFLNLDNSSKTMLEVVLMETRCSMHRTLTSSSRTTKLIPTMKPNVKRTATTTTTATAATATMILTRHRLRSSNTNNNNTSTRRLVPRSTAMHSRRVPPLVRLRLQARSHFVVSRRCPTSLASHRHPP